MLISGRRVQCVLSNENAKGLYGTNESAARRFSTATAVSCVPGGVRAGTRCAMW